MISMTTVSNSKRTAGPSQRVEPAAESPPLGTIIHFCLQPDGGVWSHIRLLARQQRPQWRVIVVAVCRGTPRAGVVEEASECADRAVLFTRPAVTGIYYMAPVNVGRVLRNLDIDPRRERVVFHFHTGPTTPWFFHLSPKIPGRRFVTFHGSRGNFLDTGFRGLPRRLLGITGAWRLKRRKFRFITISQQSARDCASMYHVPEADFQVAYSGVIAADKPRPPRAPGSASPFHIGFIGTIKSAKGWKRVIAAAQMLRERGKDVTCTVAGDGDEFAELAEIAAKNATWLRAPGRIADPAHAFLPLLDVLVVPSDYEGLPLVLPEAMSCGVPCICSNVGGCAEAIRDGKEGFVLRQNVPEEIAAGISRLIDDPALWQKFSRNGRRRYEEVFTAERMGAAMDEIYAAGSEAVLR
jgi:colanic acid/amylovoran biosynthesis glycosyltransferase